MASRGDALMLAAAVASAFFEVTPPPLEVFVFGAAAKRKVGHLHQLDIGVLLRSDELSMTLGRIAAELGALKSTSIVVNFVLADVLWDKRWQAYYAKQQGPSFITSMFNSCLRWERAVGDKGGACFRRSSLEEFKKAYKPSSGQQRLMQLLDQQLQRGRTFPR